MLRQILPISALLMGSAFLLFAGGMNGLILPVRGSVEGFSAFSLGLLGTGWAVGYIAGCVLTPRLVGKVGHIRAFGVTAAFAAISVLGSLLVVAPEAWIPLRAVSGFCFAGAAMIVESWLSERADASSRGRIFGVYTMVNLLATTAGQMALTLGDTTGYLFFVIAAMVYCLALVPTAISAAASPKPLVKVSLDLPALWQNSPVAVVAVLMVGVSNGAFGTLAAVYGADIGLTLASVALFTSLPILAGAGAQIPVGFLSDRMDRRRVLVAVTAIALMVEIAFIVLRPDDPTVNLALGAVLGAAIYALYPLIVAHANDHAAPDSAIQVSGGLLMLYGVGAIVGPLAAGFAMSMLHGTGLFMTTLAAHLVLIGFAVWRMGKRGAVPMAEKAAFVPGSPGRGMTPETAALAGQGEEQPTDAPLD